MSESRDPRPFGKLYYSGPHMNDPSLPLTALTEYTHLHGRMHGNQWLISNYIYREQIRNVLDKGKTEQEKALAKVFVKSIQVEATRVSANQRRMNIEKTHHTTEQAIDIEFPLFIGPTVEWYSHPVTGSIGGNLGGKRISIDLDELNYVEDGEPHKGVGVEQKGGWLTRDYLRTGTRPNIGSGTYSQTALLNLPYTRHLFPGEGMTLEATGLHETIDQRDQGQKESFNLNYLFEHVSRRWDRGGALDLLYPTRGYNIQDSKGSGSAVEDITTENQRKTEPVILLGKLASALFLYLMKYLKVKIISFSGYSVWGFITGLLPKFGFFGMGGLMAKVATFFGAIKAGILGTLMGPVLIVFAKLIAIVAAVFAFIAKVIVVVHSVEILTDPFSARLKNKISEKDRENYWSAGSKLPTRLRNNNLLWNGDTYRVKMANLFVDLYKTEQGNVVEQRKTQFVTLPINKLYDNLDDALNDLGVDRSAIRNIDFERFVNSDYMPEQDEHMKEIADEF